MIEEIAGDVPAYNPVFAVEAAKLCLDKSGKFAGVVLKAQSWYPDDCNRFLSVPARAIAEAARNDMLATWGTRERFWDDMVLGGACQIINFGNKSRAGLHIDTVGNRSPIQCEAPIGFPHSREALSRKEPFATDELEFSSPAALRDALRPFGKTWQLRLLHDIQFDKESGFVDFCGYDPIARENHNVLVPKSLYETAGKFLFPG
ncbi:MAG TPA: hypothetical protein VMV79_07180, partial [Alphaproteobacteria bacterium]|nr:hypothetical protein [Alphaproteobacteria bacterium]